MSYPFSSLFLERGAVALAGGLAATALAADASAQSYDEKEIEVYGAAAFFVSYAIGASQGVGLGVEARVGAREDSIGQCGEEMDPYPYGGGALRLEWFPMSHTRLLIVGQGGHTFGTIMGAHGELGAGYRWGDDAGFDTVLGAELDLSVAAFALRFDPTRLQLSPAAGFVAPPMSMSLAQSCAVAGRPMRSLDGIAPLPKLALSSAAPTGNASPEVVRVWGTRAQTEWASVPAFRELAEQLRALDAPGPLVARCYEAFADEVRHAMLAGGHCAKLGEGRVSLSRNLPSERPLLTGRAGMIRVAVESWVDGCLGEGIAAACASVEAHLAQLPDIRATQRAIAADEARHAELAWDVMQWSLEAGGDSVRGALHAAALAKPADPPAGATGAHFEEHGIVSGEQHDAIARAHRERSLERLDRMLAA